MPTQQVQNPQYESYKNKLDFINILDNLMDIIENIKDDARLKDQEYIDIMNAFSKFNNMKDKIKTTIIYREIAKVKKQKEPPAFISLREKSHICGACGRGFTTKNGLHQHNQRDICNKINQFAQFSVKEGKHHHDFYNKAKRVNNRRQQSLLELEKEQNKKAAERKGKWIDYTEQTQGVCVASAMNELLLDQA
jgi:hypothetical protein